MEEQSNPRRGKAAVFFHNFNALSLSEISQTWNINWSFYKYAKFKGWKKENLMYNAKTLRDLFIFIRKIFHLYGKYNIIINDHNMHQNQL